MKTHDQAVAEELERDPEFRREWERTALAREVARAIVAYRATLLDLSHKLGLTMRITVAPDPHVSVKVTKARAA
jgi:hypothetical protein